MTQARAPVLRKVFRAGTHRIVSPEETLGKFLPRAAAMGITRLANVTGLDVLGVPVFMATRPNSRSLSVSQGKGLSVAAAKASALMEAAEMFHAEEAVPDIARARLCDLDHDGPPIEWERLPRLTSRTFSPEAEIPWVRGHELIANAPVWVPYDLAHADYTLPAPEMAGYFPVGSTGLASGNHCLEAVCAALFELVERDATTLWAHRPSADMAARRVDLDSVDDEIARALIEQVAGREMTVSAWDLTTDVGIAVFLCRIEETEQRSPLPLPPFHGAGCHLERGIAFTRALTEAAQARLTLISGSRDDLERRNYSETKSGSLLRLVFELWERRFPRRNFNDVPTADTEFIEEDLATILQRLQAIGVRQVATVELTRPELALPVVRVVAPGLEFDNISPDYALGERARRLTENQ